MTKRFSLALAGILLLGFMIYFFQLPGKTKFAPEVEYLPKAISTKPTAGTWHIQTTLDIREINAQTPIEYQFTIVNPYEKVVKQFDVVSEKQMHLILVRQDLQEFQHIYPTLIEETGTFSVSLIFPNPGPYRLFADFASQGEQYVLWQDILVGSQHNYQGIPVIPNDTIEDVVEEYTITYDIPEIIKINNPISYSLSVSKKGIPITKFENYLGARGYSVILKEGSLDYIQAHTDAFGLQFATVFSTPGHYKLFTQFQHEGNIIISTYVIAVQDTKPKLNNPAIFQLDH